MIRIKRPRAPKFLNHPDGPWKQEIARAINHYQDNDAEAFKFEMYNDARVKDELKKVFTKCAYCESSYGAVYDGDVEHFRPKGKIKERTPQTPGYYWLANDWDNLFLACQHCNQRRKHILYGDTKSEGYGKLDQFPLDPETKRVTSPTIAWKKEERARLLVNPCRDDPDEHFAYEKEEGVIIPLTKRGEASVKVYVLQRPLLVQERKKQLLKLFKQIAITKALLQRINAAPADAALKQIFDAALDTLTDFGEAKEPYAGMSRFFIKAFLKENSLL